MTIPFFIETAYLGSLATKYRWLPSIVHFGHVGFSHHFLIHLLTCSLRSLVFLVVLCKMKWDHLHSWTNKRIKRWWSWSLAMTLFMVLIVGILLVCPTLCNNIVWSMVYTKTHYNITISGNLIFEWIVFVYVSNYPDFKDVMFWEHNNWHGKFGGNYYFWHEWILSLEMTSVV